MNALRNRFGTTFTYICCLALLTLLGGCGSKADFDKARWAKWKGTEAGINNLDGSVDILGVKIRPPKNFEALPVVDGPEGSKITAWKKQRSDGTVRSVQLMAIPVAEEMNSPTPAEALKNLFTSVRQGRRSGFNQEAVTMGFVNGIEFARTQWNHSGNGFSSEAEEGYFYVTIIGDKIYQLATQDSQNAPEGDLDVCHASILSFTN